jgi:hypothetical protein
MVFGDRAASRIRDAPSAQSGCAVYAPGMPGIGRASASGSAARIIISDGMQPQ